MRVIVALLCVLGLAGCHQAKPSSTVSHSSSAAVVKSSHKPAATITKAKLDDLLGHAFINVADHRQGLIFTSSTSGYFMDVQTSAAGADFASTDAGIFDAKITVSEMTYTIQGTAQPHAASAQVQFKKLSNTMIQQLPDGPRYQRVKHDDLNAVDAP